jgi:hypothetical protein
MSFTILLLSYIKVTKTYNAYLAIIFVPVGSFGRQRAQFLINLV